MFSFSRKLFPAVLAGWFLLFCCSRGRLSGPLLLFTSFWSAAFTFLSELYPKSLERKPLKMEKCSTEGEKRSKSIFTYLSKYYSLRFLSGLFIMGSFAIGFLAGAKYGLFTGLTSFFATVGVGIILHRIADKVSGS